MRRKLIPTGVVVIDDVNVVVVKLGVTLPIVTVGVLIAEVGVVEGGGGVVVGSV